MSLISEWEKIVLDQEKILEDKTRRIIRLKSEISQKDAEIRQLEDDIKDHEIIIKKILREQWKEEDKIINKLRKQNEVNSKLRTSGAIRGEKENR